MISVIMEVYNEEICLPYSLGGLLPVVDECVVIDGSENGPSTDGSKTIIDGFIKQYPQKVKYISGTFRREDGAWDDTVQSNVGFESVTSDFIMRTHADIVYDVADVQKIRDIVEANQDKAYFYCPLLEFFVDTKHIRLLTMQAETCLPRPYCGDVTVIAKTALPLFKDLGDFRRSSLTASVDWNKDIVYMPHVKRFHYGWVKPFQDQVLKHVRYIKRGDHEDHGAELIKQGRKAIFDYAIGMVFDCLKSSQVYRYAGEYPVIAEPLRDMKIETGYQDFERWYLAEFGEGVSHE